MVLSPALRAAHSSAAVTSVLPTPVSVPVTKQAKGLWGIADQLLQRSQQALEVFVGVRCTQSDAQPGGAGGHRGRTDAGNIETLRSQVSARLHGTRHVSQDDHLNESL